MAYCWEEVTRSEPVAPVLGYQNCDTCHFAGNAVVAVSETDAEYASAVNAGFPEVAIVQDCANTGMTHWLECDTEMRHSYLQSAGSYRVQDP